MNQEATEALRRWAEQQLAEQSFCNDNFIQQLEKQYNKRKSYDWSDKYVLIVEDDQNSVIYLEHLLKPTKIKLAVAEDGREALRMLSEEAYDMVLLDMVLPQVNGYDVVRQLKKHNNELPVVAQTAQALVEDERLCLSAGCDAYISKPIEGYLLLDIMAGLWGNESSMSVEE